MATIQCKICGGHIELPPGRTLGTCAFCGNQVTLPRVTDETHAAAFDRGNHFRRIGEFDKALAVYERIVQEDEGNAEAHWCCALCRFGIEYVKDPSTGEYLPTCHRVSFDRFLEDVDYLAALSHADDAARSQYQQDAEQIAQVQRGILAVSQSEKPFDVFICYKETDADGQRTRDSQLAQDVYYQLTDQGLRVFFARITLEDKAGTQYEPYIFAALNTAKVMVVIGTRPEHLSATWVRNEWSRFLSIMKRDRSRLLIPCYRDMDPYDMPEQLFILQSYDMSRIGFIQDLVRGIRKVVGGAKPAAPQAAPVPQAAPAAPATGPLLRRVTLFLEDGDWKSADEYAEKVLDIDPECARAYLGKLMAALRVSRQEALCDQPHPFDGDPNYQKAVRFADDELAAELRGMIAHIRERNEQAMKDTQYQKAEATLKVAKTEQDFINAQQMFAKLGKYRDAATRSQACKAARMDWLYKQAEQVLATAKTEQDFITAKSQFLLLNNHRDASSKAQECETARMNWLYKQADQTLVAAKTASDFAIVKEMFTNLDGWLDAPERAEACEVARKNFIYNSAIAQMRNRPSLDDCVKAIRLLQTIIDWRDVPQQIEICRKRIRDIDAEKVQRAAEEEERRKAKEKAKKLRIPAMRAAGRHTIAAGCSYIVGLCADDDTVEDKRWWLGRRATKPRKSGTIIKAGSDLSGQHNTYNWTDIVAIAAGDYHTVGLRTDGSVVAVGHNNFGQCDTSNWTDIVAIAAGTYHTVGIQADGSVIAVGDNGFHQCDTSSWTDIVAVAAGKLHTVGLRADGSVVAVGYREFQQLNTSGWTDIVAIAAGNYHTVGLRANGSVVAVGDNSNQQLNTNSWTDIVSIAAGAIHTVGLRTDGTVTAVGSNSNNQRNTSGMGWTNIVAIAAGYDHTIGLRSDGSVVATGNSNNSPYVISTWRLKTVPRPTLPE